MGKNQQKSDSNSSITSQNEASKLLEQALLQMDGIISGSGSSLSHSPEYGSVGVNDAAHNLVMAIHSCHMLPPPDPSVVKPIMQWLHSSTDYDEKFIKIQTEKDNLHLQVQILSEQIDAQSKKVAGLERQLQDKQQLLLETENKLQREVLSRSSLETQKLELLSLMSEMKLCQAALEKEIIELKQVRLAQNAEVIKALKATKEPHQRNISYTDDRGNPQSSSNRRLVDVYYGSLPRQQYLNASPSGVRDANANISNESRKSECDLKEKEDSPSCLKNKGLKGILCRMKRSNSGNLEDFPGAKDFLRGGIRATASPRLGCSSEPQLTLPLNIPFVEWETDSICDWLQDLGFEQYVASAKKWIKTGQQLREATSVELEKELNIKSPLHTKKLTLALIDTEENGSSDPFLSKAGKLDTVWVLRWLDDIGLPQYKDSFLVNRVDGRVLHRLTMEDLTLLHVTSMLHVVSIKRGIQVLRENDYEPDCLQRRSFPDDSSAPTLKQISVWTSHRVMEWLKAIDLAEYTPNLRGAGVHGGLMVYEIKFTAELLASLLSIPPGKTLLRRHLSNHFKELLGLEIIHGKREAEAIVGFTPLTPTLKLKLPKKPQFSLKRKKVKDEADYGDLVCPLNSNASGEHASSFLG